MTPASEHEGERRYVIAVERYGALGLHEHTERQGPVPWSRVQELLDLQHDTLCLADRANVTILRTADAPRAAGSGTEAGKR